MKAADSESLHQNLADKIIGGKFGQRHIEGQHEHRVDASEGQQAETLGQRREQQRRLSGAQKLLGVRVEGDGDGTRIELTCLTRQRRENSLVSEMHAVEVADGGHRGAEACRNLRDGMKDLQAVALSHQFSDLRFTGRERPS